MRASHILVADEVLCGKIKELLDSVPAADVPTKFAALATSKSTCSSATSGGSLGQFGRGQMVPAFDEVCWTAPIGVVATVASLSLPPLTLAQAPKNC